MANRENSPREVYEAREKGFLGKYATLSSDPRYSHRVHEYEKDDIRTEFQRDYTRLIHSRPFRRLRHKTQVFISPKNDHICTRMEHSLHVASVAETIARALGLNEDLVRAIAVGHDLGHAPFGHLGEECLNGIAERFHLKFAHELQSLRVVDILESRYEDHPGLNLSFAVRDGIACHYGERVGNRFERVLSPDRAKKPEDLSGTVRGKSRPCTLEGCVVRWADKVAYLGRDLEDALNPEVGLVKDKNEVPPIVRSVLGVRNRDIIAALVKELISAGSDNDALSVSEDVHEALNELYNFNMERIYRSELARKAEETILRSMESMFEWLLEQYDNVTSDDKEPGPREDTRVIRVFRDFLRHDVRDLGKHRKEQLVIDYIAGMTDSFFAKSVLELFLPESSV